MEADIIRLFLFNNKLKFSEIEKLLKVRSNKLSYHLKHLVEKGVLEKKNDSYSLSEASEHIIPYISTEKSALPVVLIHIGNKKECFLSEREKRPYKGFLALPGGRILLGESINNAVVRIMRQKFNISVRTEKVHSVSFENVIRSKRLLHTFFLIFVSAKTKQKIQMTNLNENKRRIIPSDFSLLKKDLDLKINIKTINSVLKE